MKTNFLIAKALPLAIMALTSASSWANNTDNGVLFPDLEKSYLKTGDFVGPDHIRRIAYGQNKDQVALQIGNPHFSEGVGNPNVWNYAFNLYTGKGNEYVTCQYQVQFKDGRSNAMYWKDKQCEQYIKPAVNQTHPITLSADGMFAFDRSGMSDLQPNGRENLNSLVAQIKSGYSNIRSIEIVGYTDRFGSTEYNQRLSFARANTVKQYLISQGVNSNVIYARGAGSSKELVSCQGPKTPAVINCLMPNRRIEVAINGDI